MSKNMKTFTSKNHTSMGVTKCEDRKIIAVDNGSITISFVFKSNKQIDKLIKTLTELKSL